jgi:hydroxyethylthiazole kinase-like sugar kinase family protein
MKIKASLEAVKSRKTVVDDIVYSVTFTVYPTNQAEIAALLMFYKRPIEIDVKEVP